MNTEISINDIYQNKKICYCPRCGNVLDKSDLPDYEYVCYNCDENFYSFEVKIKENNYVTEFSKEIL